MRSLVLLLSTFILLSGCGRVFEKGLIKLENELYRKGVVANNFTTDSLQIHYWKGGSGPAILFLHGFGGDALLTWRKELEELSKTHTVVAPDLLWFGQSKAKFTPDLSAQRRAVESLCAFLKIDSAQIVGQSYGGFLALDLVSGGKVHANKLLIANCPGTTFRVSELDKVCAAYKVRTIDELFIFDKPEFLQRLIDVSTFSDPSIPRVVQEKMYQRYFASYHNELRHLMQSLPSEQSRFQDPANFKKFPMMVLWGEKDELFPLSEGKRFAESTGASFVVIPKCGHAPQMDNHRVFTKQIKEFLE